LTISALGAALACVPLLLASCVDLDPPELRGANLGETPTGEGLRCGRPPTNDEPSLILHFIDVGQGDAIWIQTPDDGDDSNDTASGLNILVDTGKAAWQRPDGQESPVITYLSEHGLPRGGRIDYLFVTHAHIDHYGAATEIMDAYDVLNVGEPGYDPETDAFSAFLSQARDETGTNGGRLFSPFIGEGSFVESEYATTDLLGVDLPVRVLNAHTTLQPGDDQNMQVNNTSIVLEIEYAERYVLLMGDAGSEVEADILEAVPNLAANVLKVGHHGSSSSSSLPFLEAVFGNVREHRRIAIIQSGEQTFGGGVTLPMPGTITRLLAHVGEPLLFSTEFEDEESGQDEDAAAGDDHIQVLIAPNGDITSCYVD